MKGLHGGSKSRHSAAQLFLPYISYLICCAGGFLGPVHCVILSRGRWHSHSVNRIPWIGTVEEESSPGAASRHTRISRFGYPEAASAAWRQTGPSPFYSRLRPDLNDFQHRGWYWTQLQAGIRISCGSDATGLSCSLLTSYKNTHTFSFTHIHTAGLHVCLSKDAVCWRGHEGLVASCHPFVPTKKPLLWERSLSTDICL